jgi:halimadienyl-diphosphate synthase
MPATAYDTAWAARLGELDRRISDAALDWLCAHQNPDGSWGAANYHDQVVSTLAAMLALNQRGRRRSDSQQIADGLAALEKITSGATAGLSANPNATVGFELIAPSLVREAEEKGLIRHQGERILGRIGQRRDTKLARLAGARIDRSMTAAFSAEMAGPDHLDLLA